MIRIYLAVICVVGAVSGTASAEDYEQEKLTTSRIAPIPGSAELQVASCNDMEPCASTSENARARAAMALLFLGIKNNCGQRPCAIRLAANR